MERIKPTEMMVYLRQKRKDILSAQRSGQMSGADAEIEENMILSIMEVVREVDAQYLALADRLVNMGYVERKKD